MSHPEQEPLVVRDKRRLDPESGEVRAPVAPAAQEAPPADGIVGQQVPDDRQAPDGSPVGVDASDPVVELTADLQRLSAEYANYRKRVERDRVAVVEMATAGVLGQLLPLLDDVDRARHHGDLTGGFKGVGEALEALVQRLGLERFGSTGEPFDPQVHEAVMQAEPDQASSVPTCAQVLQPGFRFAGRVLRPARVSVAEAGADDVPEPTAVGGE